MTVNVCFLSSGFTTVYNFQTEIGVPIVVLNSEVPGDLFSMATIQHCSFDLQVRFHQPEPLDLYFWLFGTAKCNKVLESKLKF